MGRAAIINSETKIVENVIVTDDDAEAVAYVPPEGQELVPDPDATAWIGSTWDGETFSPIPPDEPEEEPQGG